MSKSYLRFSGYCAFFAGALIFVYSIAFVILKNQLVYSLAQSLAGLATIAMVVALYWRLKDTDAGFALLALAFSLGGTLGSAVHGGYDLANAINMPAGNAAAQADLPNQIDPRGLLTFALAGLGLFFFAWLITHGREWPASLGYLAYALAVLLVLTYLGRLVILTPSSPLILIPAALTGFIANPIFDIWLGVLLLK